MLNQQNDYKNEAELTKKVKQYLDKQPDVFYKKISDRFQNGISDILACVNGHFVAIELKAKNYKATPQQLLFIKQVQNTGGIGAVCYCVSDVEKLIKMARSSS